jgi:hypothetical protein
MAERLDYASAHESPPGEMRAVLPWLGWAGLAAAAVCVSTWVLMRSFQAREGGYLILERPGIPADRAAVYGFWLEDVPTWASLIALGATLVLGAWKLRRRIGIAPLTTYVVVHFVLWVVTMIFVHLGCGETAFP